MARVTWTETGLEDLQRHTEYIHRDSPKNAVKINRRIREAVKILKLFPEIGTVVPEFDNNAIRELIVYSFRVIYEVREEECQILFVFHGSRDLKRYFGIPDDDDAAVD